MAKDDIYQVTTTFVITIGARDIEYHTGELVDGDDPAFKRVPEHFGPVEFKHRQATKGVEQATAAPGEKRGEPERGHALTTADVRKPSKRG